MRINWKARLHNKTFLITFATLVISFIYQLLALDNIVPKVSEDLETEAVLMFINLLATLGVVTDPTTKGVCDSEKALTYYSKGAKK